MNTETAHYIRTYFSNLMTENEKLALRHHMYTYKMDDESDNSTMKKLLIKRGVISSNPEILEFLKNGYDDFELNVAKRIMEEVPEKVFFNYCPKCNKLARTPYARQCRFCGHNWHNLTVAQFKLTNSFQITRGYFFLMGQITNGEIKKGNYADLTIFGLNKKPTIETIELILQRQDGKVWEDIGLGTTELSEEDKIYIKNIGSFGTPFDILKER